MAKFGKSKIKVWIWAITCIVFFAVGIGVGRIWTISTTHTTPTKMTRSALSFNIPQVPLPTNWPEKQDLPGNSFETAYLLNPGIQTQGTINNDNAIDYYSFNIKDPSQIIVNVTNVPKALYWVVYDNKLNEIASTYRTGVSQGATQVPIQNPGKYYLKVWADYHLLTNYPYTIRLSILPYFE